MDIRACLSCLPEAETSLRVPLLAAVSDSSQFRKHVNLRVLAKSYRIKCQIFRNGTHSNFNTQGCRRNYIEKRSVSLGASTPSKLSCNHRNAKSSVLNSKMALLNILNLYSVVTAIMASTSLIIVGYFMLNEWVRYRSRIKGLSGPLGLPIIGNLHQVTSNQNYSSQCTYDLPDNMFRFITNQHQNNIASGLKNTDLSFKSSLETPQWW